MSDAISWEYDAPKSVDFQNLEHEQDDGAEDYFNYHTEDDNFDHPGEIPEEFSIPLRLATGSINSCSKQPAVKFDETKHNPQSVAVVKPMRQVSASPAPLSQNTDAAVSTDEINVSGIAPIRHSTTEEPPATPTEASSVSEKAESPKNPVSQKKKIPNLMTPSRLASWNTGKTKQVGKENSMPRRSKNLNEGSGSVSKKPLRRSIRQNKTPLTSNGEPALKRAKSNSQKVVPKHHRANSMDVTKLLKFPTNKSGTHKRALTSEEMELQKIEQMKKETEQTKKENEKFLKKSLKQPVHAPVPKSHCTKTKEFHFKTDERIAKSHSMALRSDVSCSKEFTTDLRKHNPSPYKPKKTVPRPFHFSDEKKRKLEDCEHRPDPFVPMAKAIIDFHKATPRRFKQPAKSGVAPAGPMKATALRITEPKTPKFTFKPRNKPITTMSAKEKEELELEEIRKYEFKANPIKKSVLEGKEKLKPVAKKAATKPIEFHLSEANKDRKSSDQEIKPKPFKAQAVPTLILEKVTGLKEKPAVERTVPTSPAFALKERAKARAEKAQRDEIAKKAQISEALLLMKANKIHHETQDARVYGIPLKPAIEKKRRTTTKPFSFDQSDTERFQKKEERIKEIVSEDHKSASFKARPMPVLSTPMLPPKEVKEATKAKPFKLQANERASKRVEEWNKQVTEEVKHLREQTLFKANENYDKVLKGKPFEPKVSHRVIEPADVKLHSDQRAKQRELHAMRREAEARKLEAAIEEQKRLEAEEEEKRIAKLRKELVHKAQGVPKYKTMEIKQSVKELTNPQSPNFSDRFKK
uniref:Targeting protein for Xklp2 n=1 Tax=Phallusia mammillata TaxID=59560 RepID=A0A6F9DW09_9ASCI|nr:targeting protein for Xklp2 [Phallusia mammillata]